MLSEWNLTTTVEPWEKSAVQRLMLQLGLVAFLITGICIIFIQMMIMLNIQGIVSSQNTYIFLVLPWVLILVFGSRHCFHKGVVDEYMFAVGEGELNIDKHAPNLWNVVDWEKEYINRIILGQVLFAAVGTLALVGLGDLMQKFTDVRLSPVILFSPWAVIMIIEVSRTYHLGVLAQRTRIRGRRDADRRLAPRRKASAAVKNKK